MEEDQLSLHLEEEDQLSFHLEEEDQLSLLEEKDDRPSLLEEDDDQPSLLESTPTYPVHRPNKDDDYLKAAMLVQAGKNSEHLKNCCTVDACLIVRSVLTHASEIDYIIDKMKLYELHPELDKAVVKVIVGDLLWGRKTIRFSRDIQETDALRPYLEQMQELYWESMQVTEKLSVGLPIYLRVNTLAIGVKDAIDEFCREGFKYMQPAQTYKEFVNKVRQLSKNCFLRDYHISELLVFAGDATVFKHPGCKAGKFVVQDKASCLASFLLNPKPGAVVLEVGAACGLKTNHLVNIMNNEGLVIANDMHPGRVKLLEEFLGRTSSAGCVKIHEANFLTTTFQQASLIKYILIDVSTSNSGMAFDQPKVKRKPSKGRRQKLGETLRLALQTFPNVKRVVYAACSIYPSEGEMVVQEAKTSVGESFQLLDVREMLWGEWTSVCSANYPHGGRCMRTIPQFDHCWGYFVAVFERNPEVAVPEYVRQYEEVRRVDVVFEEGKEEEELDEVDEEVEQEDEEEKKKKKKDAVKQARAEEYKARLSEEMRHKVPLKMKHRWLNLMKYFDGESEVVKVPHFRELKRKMPPIKAQVVPNPPKMNQDGPTNNFKMGKNKKKRMKRMAENEMKQMKMAKLQANQTPS